jgi:hypothetical protein
MMTPERIARNVFGSADWLKVQSQHERFLKEIKKLPDDKKAIEILNAVKYLLANKSDYWLETAHLLHILIGDNEQEGLYKKIAPGISKQEFCESDKYLSMKWKTVHSYIYTVLHSRDFGFTDEQIRVLGFSKTRELLINKRLASEMSKKTPEELRLIKRSIIRSSKPQLYYLHYHWNKATESERKRFLREINARANSKLDQKAGHS